MAFTLNTDIDTAGFPVDARRRRVIIIVPTYNERGNIVRLIPRITEQSRELPYDFVILVVDDHSPDGTADAVREMMPHVPELALLEGEKKGLGAAYLRGMRHALDTLDADIVFEMDADFSHDPADIPRMLAAIESGSDFVIGSRYVPGGSIPAEWPWTRRLISWGGNLFARIVAGIAGVRDCTAGFRAIDANVLRKVRFGNITVQGYAFQVALLHEAIVHGASVREIPVHFRDRGIGESKLGLRDILEFALNAWWIRLRNHAVLVKFLVVGATGVIVNLGCFALLLGLGVNKYLASPLAIELSILSNFLLNNYWTFRWRDPGDSVPIRGLKFNIVSLGTLTLSYATFVLLTLAMPDRSPLIPQMLAVIPGAMVNYFLNSYWTFGNQDGRE